MRSWIRSLKKDLVTSWFTIALPGGLVTKDGGHCSAKDLCVFFYAHLQDGRGERDVVSIFIFSTLIQMNNPFYIIVLGSQTLIQYNSMIKMFCPSSKSK